MMTIFHSNAKQVINMNKQNLSSAPVARRHAKQHLSLAIVLGSGLLLSACQMAPLELQSQVEYPGTFTEVMPGIEQTDIRQWWRHFNDPVLDQLIQRALMQAPDLREAELLLDAARATARLADADLGPMVGATAGGSIMRSNIDNPLPENIRQPIESLGSEAGNRRFDIDGDTYQLGLVASWAPDLFGKKRSDADAAGYMYLAAREKNHGARMLLTATLAQHYLQARSLEKQMEVLVQTEAALGDLKRYAQARFELGQASRYDVDDISVKQQGIQARQATLQAQRDTHVRQIAVLSGQVPQHFTLPRASVDIFANLPAPPQGYYPNDLLTNRPDIRSKQAVIYALAAKHASAQADLFPRFSLNFGLFNGQLSIDDNGLDSIGSRAGIASANIHLPLFTNGRIKLNIDAAEAKAKAAMADYDKTLLNALSEVESSYAMNHALREQYDKLDQAVATAATQVENSKKLFDYGRLTFDKIPTAEINANEMRQHRLDNELLQALNLIALYQSLGGGWNLD